ncbi:MFS transporter [Bailinhaonella thermotolerans]|uniref:Putative proline/betaine transporter n=1 Tax=Bailinhaonella thermotolerans TaxID=1070861 RepID=A0A3A4BAJ7_9ACTN|nr:MFS transporter [Bailinhaonella thermotolerans]RJL35949.1 MFS transporter [Bailinhaonella thermotolerans]
MSTAAVPPQSRTRIGRVLLAGLVGTAVEWYDFFLYGSAAALVFNKLFFPESDPLVGTMLAFLTYALGFVARPLGGLVFGHFGDRVGRKKLLMVSLVLMGVATAAIGLLPTYSSIGIWAAVLLTLLRLVQGFAIGGEWGGAVLLVSEHGSPARRGFYASWPQAGVPVGNLLATAVLAVLAATMPDAVFESWGWRIPFLLSALLILFGYWVRSRVEDAPVFLEARARAEAEQAVRRAPALEALRRHPKQIGVCISARMAENISYYVITAFVLTYVTTHLELSRSLVLNALLVANVAHLIAIPAFGALSDRVGRRPVYLFGTIGMGLWAFAFFALLDTRNPALITLAVVGGLIAHAAMYGPQAAFFAEQFDTTVRYSGTSIGYQVTSIIAGSVAPLIATALLASYGTPTPIAWYVAIAAVISTAGVLAAKETRSRDLAQIPTP